MRTHLRNMIILSQTLPLTIPCCYRFLPFLQVRTHLRNMIIIPEMIGSVVGVYNGKTFNQVRWALLSSCCVKCRGRLRRGRVQRQGLQPGAGIVWLARLGPSSEVS